MKVSVIIPVYNGERYIAACIRSVLSQTMHDYEIIVINDGSTDNSKQEILKFQEHIIYIEQNNRGVSNSRNVGILKATGQYIAFLDHDDLFHPQKLLKMSSFLDQNQHYGLVYSYLARIDGESRNLTPKQTPSYTGDIFPKLFLKSYLYPSIVVCRRQILLDAGLFQEKFSSLGEDCDMFLRVAQLTKVGVVKEYLSVYRIHAANASKDQQEIIPFVEEALLLQYKQYLLDNYTWGWLYFRRKMSKVYREQAKILFKQGHDLAAKAQCIKAFSLYPIRAEVLKLYCFG